MAMLNNQKLYPYSSGLWYTYPSEKYESQWEGLSHILGKIKHDWNHQPVLWWCNHDPHSACLTADAHLCLATTFPANWKSSKEAKGAIRGANSCLLSEENGPAKAKSWCNEISSIANLYRYTWAYLGAKIYWPKGVTTALQSSSIILQPISHSHQVPRHPVRQTKLKLHILLRPRPEDTPRKTQDGTHNLHKTRMEKSFLDCKCWR